jgi:hypothetical protein
MPTLDELFPDRPDRPPAAGRGTPPAAPSPMSRHDCPAGCGARVPGDRFACPTDWRRLPQVLRRAISMTFRRDPMAHAAAMSAAVAWYREHPHNRTEGRRAPERP